MSNSAEIRWKQRFENLLAAAEQFKDACAKESYSQLELAGLVQVFEFTFELCWKTFKDKLFYEGYEVNSPRQAIRLAFEQGLIADAAVWLEALESRNRLSHTYNKSIADEAEKVIKKVYFPMITDAIARLNEDYTR